ncbi:MAG: mitofilin family membrane protein, partial [Alphaproteobacteria bacterium]|nr:mitofilin family membrane protein [Alphaproteobacteria bacterium]
MTSGSKRRTGKKKTSSGGGAKSAARGPGRRAADVSTAGRDKKTPPAEAKKTATAPPAEAKKAATAPAAETAGAAAPGETAAAGDRTAAAEPATKGSGIAPFLWTVLALAVLGGAAAATWPLWSPYITAGLSSTGEDPFRDPRVTGLAGRGAALEETTEGAGGAGGAVEDLEQERARSRQELKALMERMETLEQALRSVKKMGEATAPPAESADRDEYLRQLSERLGRLENDDGTLERLFERIARLEQRGGATGEGVQPAARAEELSAAVAAISKRVGALERTDTMAAGAAIGAQAAVLAVGQLREALRGTAPFAAELQAVGAVTADNPAMTEAIAALEPYVASGIPTLATLRRDFDRLAGEIARAARALDGDGWFEWTVNRLMSLVTVRRTTDSGGPDSADDSVDAVVARAETSLVAGDLMAAVEELEGLAGPP